jgi:hypothetical protein
MDWSYTLEMSNMYPPDNGSNSSEDTEHCNLCGAPYDLDCHPSCPNSMEPAIAVDIYAVINNALLEAADEFFSQYAEVKQEKLFTDRIQSMVDDWTDLGKFGKALWGTGMLAKAIDVVEFMNNPKKFHAPYTIWNELGKPTDFASEEFKTFKLEVLNRRK